MDESLVTLADRRTELCIWRMCSLKGRLDLDFAGLAILSQWWMGGVNGPLGQHSRPDESDKPEGESTSVWLGFGRVTAVFASNAICSGNGMMLCNFLFFWQDPMPYSDSSIYAAFILSAYVTDSDVLFILFHKRFNPAHYQLHKQLNHCWRMKFVWIFTYDMIQPKRDHIMVCALSDLSNGLYVFITAFDRSMLQMLLKVKKTGFKLCIYSPEATIDCLNVSFKFLIQL